MNPQKTVDALLSLQKIDERIHEDETELDQLAAPVEELEEKVEGLRAELDEARDELEEAEEALRSDRRSVEAGRSTLKRLQERAREVQNMQQHKAIRSELNSARENLDRAEDAALESMQRVDDARDRVRELEEELEEAEEELDSTARETGARREELQEELSRERERRRERARELDDSVVRLYERVREGTTRNVLAPLDGNHCGHCYTMVPPQRRREIASGEELHRCEGCGVILHPPGVREGEGS